jgi:hypothetical protein
MKITKQARRDAKQLFNGCRANGTLDEAKVRQTVQAVNSMFSLVRSLPDSTQMPLPPAWAPSARRWAKRAVALSRRRLARQVATSLGYMPGAISTVSPSCTAAAAAEGAA